MWWWRFSSFFFQCIIFFDVVHDVCENCIFRHRDAQCSHNEYVFFVESMNFSNKRTIRSIARSIIVETKNMFNYLIVRRNRFFVFTIFTMSTSTNFVFVSTSTIVSITSFIFIFTTTIQIVMFESIDTNQSIENFIFE